MSFVRIAASAAIFTLLSAVGATAKPIATTAETNLRKSPGTDSPVLTIIPKGTTVEVGKCSNGWCETSTDGRDGYVIAPAISAWRRRGEHGLLRRSMTRKWKRLGRLFMVRGPMSLVRRSIMAIDPGAMGRFTATIADGAGRLREPPQPAL